VSSELVVTELPRAIRHKAAVNRRIDLASSLTKSEILLEKLLLHPSGRLTFSRAGRLFDPHLGSLDAIHVMTAIDLRPIEAFVTYDRRQAAAARDVGFPTISPGA
jgi:predicted nucleic acid-binding protein